MSEPAAKLSEAEARFERARQRAGFALAPLVGVVLWFAPVAGLDAPAHRLLAVLGLVVTLWVCESIPLAATALLGPALCVAAGIAPAREVFRSFADPIIFVFLGGFLIAEATLHHGLNRRIALSVLGLPGVGRSPARLLLAFGGVTAFISMWVSNTATTAMMFPIAVAILSEMARRRRAAAGRAVHFTELRFGAGLMLMTAFAASVGGVATPVGTPPNLIGLGFIERELKLDLTFFQWMTFAVPLAVVLVLFLGFHLQRFGRAEPDLLTGGREWLAVEKATLGALTRAERNVLVAFGVTVCLWVLPGVTAVWRGDRDPLYLWLNSHVPESVAALLGSLLLFVLPVDWARREFTLSWREATRIDWGTLLLFGGGLALGELMFATGLARWIGEGLAHALRADTALGLIVLFTGIGILVSETTSNAASANMVVPVAIAVAQAAGVDPLRPALAACLGASMGFMLPVSTPPNAIVYGSGCVPLMKMVRYGLALDVAGFLAIVATVTWLVPLVIPR
jgi:sodium-dependent dicarboxylate transporter 2/3/5